MMRLLEGLLHLIGLQHIIAVTHQITLDPVLAVFALFPYLFMYGAFIIRLPHLMLSPSFYISGDIIFASPPISLYEIFSFFMLSVLTCLHFARVS